MKALVMMAILVLVCLECEAADQVVAGGSPSECSTLNAAATSRWWVAVDRAPLTVWASAPIGSRSAVLSIAEGGDGVCAIVASFELDGVPLNLFQSNQVAGLLVVESATASAYQTRVFSYSVVTKRVEQVAAFGAKGLPDTIFLSEPNAFALIARRDTAGVAARGSKSDTATVHVFRNGAHEERVVPWGRRLEGLH